MAPLKLIVPVLWTIAGAPPLSVPDRLSVPLPVKVILLPVEIVGAVVPVEYPPFRFAVPVEMVITFARPAVACDCILNNPETVSVPEPTAIVLLRVDVGRFMLTLPAIFREFAELIFTILLAAGSTKSKLPFTVTSVLIFIVAPLAIMIFSKLADPLPALIAADAVPKVTVPVPSLKVPLLSQGPFTVSVNDERFKTEPELIVTPAQVWAALKVTELPDVVAITTRSPTAGAFPPTHVDPVFQLPPLDVEVMVAAMTETVCRNICYSRNV